jgi:hypothetical protein
MEVGTEFLNIILVNLNSRGLKDVLHNTLVVCFRYISFSLLVSVDSSGPNFWMFKHCELYE